jgi:hypothetical protein
MKEPEHAVEDNPDSKENEMNTNTSPRNGSGAGNTQRASAPLRTLTTPHLNPQYLGLAVGATGLVFYLGCMLTMATVPHDAAVIFFNSLLHGFDVEPVLRTSVPVSQVMLGLASTFGLGWLAGAMVAGIYNLSLGMGK